MAHGEFPRGVVLLAYLRRERDTALHEYFMLALPERHSSLFLFQIAIICIARLHPDPLRSLGV